MSGIKNKKISPQYNRNKIKIIVGSMFIVLIIGCTKYFEREEWIIPCNIVGDAKVYFTPQFFNNSLKGRFYRLNDSGICYSNLNPNEGYSPDMNKTVTILIDCNGSLKKIKLFDPTDGDTIKLKRGQRYAVGIMSGFDSLHFEQLSIFMKK